MFTAGLSPPQVATRLRVSTKSSYAWHRSWRDAGCEALRSTGPASRPRLDDTQQARLAAELDRGPAV